MGSMDQNNCPYLHLYGQGGWHDDAHIVADRDGLVLLRDAINAALAADQGRVACQVFANDGEGYSVAVTVLPTAEMMGMALPYADEAASGQRSGVIWPVSLPGRPTVLDHR